MIARLLRCVGGLLLGLAVWCGVVSRPAPLAMAAQDQEISVAPAPVLQALKAMAQQGLPSQAIAQAESLLSQYTNDPDLLVTLGVMLDDVAEFDAANTCYAQALTNATAQLGPRHPGLIPFLSAMGEHYIHAGALDVAAQWFETAASVVDQAMGSGHLNGQAFYNVMGSLALLGGQWDAAIGNATISLDIATANLWPEHPARVRALGLLGEAQLRQGDLTQARRTLGQAIQLGQTQLGHGHPDVLLYALLDAAAQALTPQAARTGELDQAAAQASELFRISLDAWGPAWPRLVMKAEAWDIVQALERTGRQEEALALQRQRLHLWDAARLTRHWGRDEDAARLASLLLRAGHAEEALERLESLLGPSVWERLLLVQSPADLEVCRNDLLFRAGLAEQLAAAHPALAPRALALHDAVHAGLRQVPTLAHVQALQRTLREAGPNGLEQLRLRTMAMRMQAQGPQGIPLDLYAHRLALIKARIISQTPVLPAAP